MNIFLLTRVSGLCYCAYRIRYLLDIARPAALFDKVLGCAIVGFLALKIVDSQLTALFDGFLRVSSLKIRHSRRYLQIPSFTGLKVLCLTVFTGGIFASR
jgi:hypothetical protein